MDLVCLQETKLQNLSSADARSLGVGRLADGGLWRLRVLQGVS